MDEQKESNLHQPMFFGGRTAAPTYCETCVFAHGKPPFADRPEKSYCRIYTREGGKQKPPDVYYEGARCEFYEQEKRKK